MPRNYVCGLFRFYRSPYQVMHSYYFVMNCSLILELIFILYFRQIFRLLFLSLAYFIFCEDTLFLLGPVMGVRGKFKNVDQFQVDSDVLDLYSKLQANYGCSFYSFYKCLPGNASLLHCNELIIRPGHFPTFVFFHIF